MSATKTRMSRSHFNIASSCFIGYVACYAAKNVLSSIKPEMTEAMKAAGNDPSTMLGLAASLFFLSYAIGQLVNGTIGDYIRAKIVIALGLVVSAATLFVFPTAITMDKTGIIPAVLWCICGYSLSMLWAPMTKVIAENLPDNAAVQAMTSLSVASVLGMEVTYLVCAAVSAIKNWQLGFYICGGITVAVAVLSYILLDVTEKKGDLVMIHAKSKAEKAADGEVQQKSFKELAPLLIARGIIPMLIVSFTNGIGRNAVTFCMPTYINQSVGTSSAWANLLTAITPFISIAGTYVGLFLMKYLRDSESMVNGIFYFGSAVLFALLPFTSSLPVLNLIFLFIACGAMNSICNLIYSKYCMRFSDTGRASFISGFLDFISYLATAIATPLIDLIVVKFGEQMGWNVNAFSWAIISVIGGVASLWTLYLLKKDEKKTRSL